MQDETRTVRISGERLAEVWREVAMSKETFAQAIGLKRSGTFRLMRPGTHAMFTDNFRRMATALNTTPDELKRRIGVSESDDDADAMSGVAGDAQPLVEIASFHSVSAGVRSERLGIETGTVRVPPNLGDFCVRIDGDSMMPEYPNRAMAVFKSVEGQQFIYGQDYIIWFTNDECYFSRVFESDNDRDVLLLQKINPDRERFPDRTVHRREIARVAHCTAVTVRKT
ncbi:MAG TPA: S24 family peptidase [Bryobacteraceae bacterium]|nr:S24 family peptidase [Bryobacteraceae bacterium]